MTNQPGVPGGRIGDPSRVDAEVDALPVVVEVLTVLAGCLGVVDGEGSRARVPRLDWGRLDSAGLRAAAQGLPRLAEAAAAGRLSADQARPVSQLADTESDAAWAVQAQGLPAAVLARRLARRKRPVAADHRAARAA